MDSSCIEEYRREKALEALFRHIDYEARICVITPWAKDLEPKEGGWMNKRFGLDYDAIAALVSETRTKYRRMGVVYARQQLKQYLIFLTMFCLP